MIQNEQNRHAYVGGGVYAEFDGYGIVLRTSHHDDAYCDNKIYLEPFVLSGLNEFYRLQRGGE